MELEEQIRTATRGNGQSLICEKLSRLDRIYDEIWEKNVEAYEILRSFAAREEPAAA